MPHRPILLGIVGDSAAGKTTLTNGIAELIGADRVTTVCTDDYHKYDRVQRKELGITPLHPDCNYMDIMEQHVAALADGKPILKPVYNHTTGTFDPPEYIVPKKFVIIEGLLAFHTPALREPFHVKVYLDPPEELRREWKIKRDCAKRGYQREDVLREMEKREHDSATWIRPQKQHADLVVRFHGDTAPVPAEHLSLRLTMRPTLPHPDLSPLTEREQSPLRLTIEREQGRLVEHVELDGSVDPAEAARIEQMIWGQQPEIRQLADRTDGLFADGQETRRSVPLAVSQLLIAYHLLLGRLAKEQLAKSLEQARTASA